MPEACQRCGDQLHRDASDPDTPRGPDGDIECPSGRSHVAGPVETAPEEEYNPFSDPAFAAQWIKEHHPELAPSINWRY